LECETHFDYTNIAKIFLAIPFWLLDLIFIFNIYNSVYFHLIEMENVEKNKKRKPGRLNRFIKRKIDNMDSTLGKKFYGNTSGFKKNLSGKKNQLLAKTQSNYHKNENVDPSIIELKKKGFLIFERQVDQKTIHEIQKKYEEIINDDRYSHIRAQNEGKIVSRATFHAHKNFPELSKLLTKELIKKIEGWYEGYFRVKRISCWRNYHLPPEIASKDIIANRWHCDQDPSDLYGIIIVLSDVGEDCGPFTIQSIERTKELMKMGYGTRESYNIPQEVLEDPKHVVKCVGIAGTGILCNNERCLHKAEVPGPGKQRDVVEFLFVPSNKPLPANWLENVEDDPEEEFLRKKFTHLK